MKIFLLITDLYGFIVDWKITDKKMKTKESKGLVYHFIDAFDLDDAINKLNLS